MLVLGSPRARGSTPAPCDREARAAACAGARRLPAGAQAATLERLLAYQLLLPAGPAAQAGPTAWQRGLRAAKIGATGVGVGALFAVTGGLAAPAIAAGVGAAITLVGGAGAAAAAAGAAGFLATAAGTTATAAGVGVAGGSFAGSRMARRTGDVREFGFVELAAAEGADAAGAAGAGEPGPRAGGAPAAAPAAGPGGPVASPAAAAAGGRGRPDLRVTNSGEEEEPAFSPRGDAERDPFLLSRPPDPAPGRGSPPDPAEPWGDDAAPPARALELRDLGGARGGPTERAAAPDPYAEHVDEGHLALPARALLGGARPGAGRGPGGAEEPGRRELPGRAAPAEEHASAPAAGPADASAGSRPGGAPLQAVASAGAPAGAPAGPGRRSQGGAGPPGAGARGGNASGSPTRGAGAGPGSWAWPRRRDPPLLSAPISATVRADDMRMALTIGARPPSWAPGLCCMRLSAMCLLSSACGRQELEARQGACPCRVPCRPYAPWQCRVPAGAMRARARADAQQLEHFVPAPGPGLDIIRSWAPPAQASAAGYPRRPTSPASGATPWHRATASCLRWCAARPPPRPGEGGGWARALLDARRLAPDILSHTACPSRRRLARGGARPARACCRVFRAQIRPGPATLPARGRIGAARAAPRVPAACAARARHPPRAPAIARQVPTRRGQQSSVFSTTIRKQCKSGAGLGEPRAGRAEPRARRLLRAAGRAGGGQVGAHALLLHRPGRRVRGPPRQRFRVARPG